MEFGQEGGPAITNKASVLSEVDRVLGKSKPPDVEVLLTQAWAPQGPINRHYLFNRWGHVGVRFTVTKSNGEYEQVQLGVG